MSDELATAVVLIVTALITIAAAFAWWVNRPQRSAHESEPRIQPLFAAETVGAVAGGVDELDHAEPVLGAGRDLTPGVVADGDRPLRDPLAGFSRPDRQGPPVPSAAPQPADSAASAWESAAALAQRNTGQPAQSRPGSLGAQGPRLGPSPWAIGGLRREPGQAMPPGVPLGAQGHEERLGERPLVERQPDRHADRQPDRQPDRNAERQPDRHAERHVERFADRQPERFAQGTGGARQARATEWTTGGAPRPAYPAPVAAPRWSDGGSVRFSIPTDRTLQFLPGRLEITSGHDKGREIRFVRLPSAEPEITFGRNEGAPYRHVQLRDGTVSRLHARMRLHEGRWTLTNLSTTNPVTYNGRVLGDAEEQPLDEDDRIEMGEVAFRFRTR